MNKLKLYLTRLDIHTKEVVSKSISSSFVKVIGMIIGLLVSIYLGRNLGADGLGVINLTIRMVNILIVFGLLGIRQVIIKEVAIAHNKDNLGHVGNVVYSSILFNGIITLLIVGLIILLSPWLSKYVFSDVRLLYPLIIALLAMVFQVISRIYSSALIGFRKIWQSNLVDQTLSFAVIGILLILCWYYKINLTITRAAMIYAFGRLFVTVSIFIYWKCIFKNQESRRFIIKQLLYTSLPIFLVTAAGVMMNNINAVILGSLSNTSDVGLFTVASKLALLTSFFLQVTNSTVGPKLAALYNNGSIKEMEKMLQNVTKGLLIIGLVPFLIFLVAGNEILQIWGSEFNNAYLILVILSFGQLFNIGTGASGAILMMCKLEKIYAKTSVIILLTNIILCIILTYNYGIIGTAISTCITIVVDNIIRVIIIKIKINVWYLPVWKK